MRLGRVDDETTANLGTIEGGRAVNIIPNEVTVRGEARSLSAAKLKAQTDHMVACFAEAVARAILVVDGKRFEAALDYVVRPSYGGMSIAEDAPLVKRVIAAAARLGRVIKPQGTGGGCDANILNQRGLVVANLGTGMRDIHTVREWLDVRDMTATAEVTLELLALQAESA
jgi:tripeptide aminopeptidase